MHSFVFLAAALATAYFGQQAEPMPYLAPGTPQVGGVRHLCLIYHGRAGRVQWTKEAIMPYVAYVDEEGKPSDWFFDSFLFIEFATDAGASLYSYREAKTQPAIADWQWLADCWFREDTGLIGLERAVAEAGRVLGQNDHMVNVAITLPMPLREIESFGPLPGEERTLHFGDEQDRQRALAWYIGSVLQRWEEAGYEHLRLVGFYWLAESIPGQDHAIVESTATHVHGKGYRLYWIPYFGATGVLAWRARGIDAAMLQPNHFFAEQANERRLLDAARRARAAGCGIEIEFDARALSSEDHQHRFWAYLDAGVKYGWMNRAILGYYEGGGAIKKFAETPGLGRELYDAVFRFAKGTYEVSGKVRLPPDNLIRHGNTGNIALASKGANIIGCVRREDQPELAPEKIIDGDMAFYGGMSGFRYFAWPGSFTIELAEASTVARAQTMLWDLDGRHFRYRIETSLDGEHWELAVDKSEGECVGWQIDEFSARRAKYVRLTGLYNSVNDLFQVVEFEVYPTHQ